MVKIISDSTCDLTPDLLSKYDIDILPLHILLGEKEYKDGINITPDQIYSWSDANKTTPKTSAPALSETIELFRPYVEEGRNIVCFSISNSMSSSGNVMQLAAEELDAQDLITVIDSANLSTGIGLLVIEAAILAQNNKTAAEISVVVESLKPYVRASFVVDTLTYLHRGGRCSAIAAMVTQGESRIQKVVAVMPDGRAGPPCGACRELMMQLDRHSPEIEILLDYDTRRSVTLGELMPDWWGRDRFSP